MARLPRRRPGRSCS